ncbi:hypothetical protein [Nonomuraea fuscirosea]|uniref:hypothetical protein n=1 Tax=Nonomuraea fuscirosea TaxID=1291556 RepID=UPI00341BB0BC
MSLPAADRARERWSRLAGSPVGFPGPGDVGVVVSPESSLCPPGWSGMAELDGAIVAVVPRPDLVDGVRTRLRALLGDGAGLSRLAVGEVLGPAELAYLDETDFRPAGVEVERLPSGHGDVEALLASVPEADGLLPQWRARPAASRRVAAALGFRRHGEQLSVRDLAAAIV